jgi:hypothetical protein
MPLVGRRRRDEGADGLGEEMRWILTGRGFGGHVAGGVAGRAPRRLLGGATPRLASRIEAEGKAEVTRTDGLGRVGRSYWPRERVSSVRCDVWPPLAARIRSS